MPNPPRPNILLILADQHRYDCVGANTGRFDGRLTPNLDAIAGEGMNFRHAFTPIPLCIPARNCLFHGQWSFRHRAIANWDTEAPRPAIEGLPAFVDGLRAAGYFLGHVGKWHVHPQKHGLDYGFHEYVPESGYPAWRSAQGWPPPPVRPYNLPDAPDRFVEQWFGGLDPGAPPEGTRLAWGADHVVRMLEDRRRDSRPFFIQWWPSEPHLPCFLPEPYYSMFPPAEISPWPGFPDPLDGKPYIQAQQRRTWRIEGRTWEEWQPLVSRYLGTIALLDACVGRVLEALEAQGLADNTWVVYTADHGDMCGSHGMIDKHYVMYDDVTRVPLLMRWPGRIPPGSVAEGFVCHMLDLARTFLEVAGAPVPADFLGESLLPLFDGAAGRSDIFAAYHGNQFGLYTQRMLRTRRWKYVWNATAEDELYDLERDPGEIRNRARDPACQETLARLRARLVQWMEETGDPILNQWTRPQLLDGLSL